MIAESVDGVVDVMFVVKNRGGGELRIEVATQLGYEFLVAERYEGTGDLAVDYRRGDVVGITLEEGELEEKQIRGQTIAYLLKHMRRAVDDLGGRDIAEEYSARTILDHGAVLLVEVQGDASEILFEHTEFENKPQISPVGPRRTRNVSEAQVASDQVSNAI